MEEFNRQKFLISGVSSAFYDSTYEITGHIIHELKELQEKIREVVENKRVIEIGCGYNGGLCLEMLMLGASMYEGIDPFYLPNIDEFMKWKNNASRPIEEKLREKIRFFHRDALSYLKSISDDSQVVTLSMAILEADIIHDEKYERDLVAEIARLAQAYPSAIHVVDNHFAKLFKEYGLQMNYEYKIPLNNFTYGIFLRAK